MTPETVLPLTVIGGYLGAGKTTLVNHLLRNAGGARLAVLVNEFGDLAIDEDLIEARDGNLISIAGGCICCSFGDDLAQSLRALAALQPRPDHVVIEASGVAMPGSIAATVSLLGQFQVNGLVVLADAETVRARSEDAYMGDTILRQLAGADLIVLTKTDLVDADTAKAVTVWLQSVCQGARIVAGHIGQLPTPVILGDFAQTGPFSGQDHADAGFDSVVLRFDGPVDAGILAASLAAGDLGVVRAKGFVADLSGQTALVQVVGKRHTVSPAPGVLPAGVVCIGLAGHLNRRELGRLTVDLKENGPVRPA